MTGWHILLKYKHFAPANKKVADFPYWLAQISRMHITAMTIERPLHRIWIASKFPYVRQNTRV